MSDTPVRGRMRGSFIRYLLALTVMWVVTLWATGMLPKEGEMISRDGVWRLATEADRIQSLVWFSGYWYFGALVALGLVWQVAQAMYDVAFGPGRGSERLGKGRGRLVG